MSTQATEATSVELPTSWYGKKPTPEQLALVLKLHEAWWYGRPEGARAVLRGADLSGAVLRGADLSGAVLRDADLRGAVLRGAVLRDAVLRGAVLRGAVLRDADLRGADLRGAVLRGAVLRDAVLSDATVLSDGLVWREYVEQLVPALCVAGGKALDAVANPAVWECHAWHNCPMHAAFGAEDLGDVPPLYREQARFFIACFDGRLLDLERVNPGVTERWSARGEAPACEVAP